MELAVPIEPYRRGELLRCEGTGGLKKLALGAPSTECLRGSSCATCRGDKGAGSRVMLEKYG